LTIIASIKILNTPGTNASTMKDTSSHNASLSSKATLQPWLPYALVIIWLFFLAITIWHHALASQQPPIYDGLSYFLKAKNYWEAISQHRGFNPFSIAPAVRPPGTVLMSFPFGYDGNFHAFHFRSIFFPLALTVIAAWISLRSRIIGPPAGIVSVALVLALSSLPLFYSFEPNSQLASHIVWGHVDSFFAALAAVAAASTIASLHARSLGWLLVGALAASFSLWVKPSGLMIMALNTILWTAFAIGKQFLSRNDSEVRFKNTRYLVRGLLLMLPLYSLVIVISTVGGYLTMAEIEYFSTGMEVLKSLRTSPWTIQEAVDIVRSTVGFPYAALCLICILGAVPAAARARGITGRIQDPAIIGIVGGVCFLIAGLGWWIWATSGVMVRYMFPFMLMFAISMLPSIGIVAMRSAPIVRICVVLIGFGAAINIAVLLVTPEPSPAWQRATGVNLSAGVWNVEAEAARQFFTREFPRDDATVIYVFGAHPPTTVFESVMNFVAATEANAPNIQFLRPIDWLRPAAYRFNELLSADYLLVTPLRGGSLPVTRTRYDNYYLEEEALRIWASSLSDVDGVHAEINLPNLLLLKIVDRSALHKTATALIDKFTWSSAFLTANANLWTDASRLSTEISQRRVLARDVVFGEAIDILALTANRDGADKISTIDVWWRPKNEQLEGHAKLLFEFKTESGQTTLKGEIRLPMREPPDPSRPIRFDSATFRLPIQAHANELFLSANIGSTSLSVMSSAASEDPYHVSVSLSGDTSTRRWWSPAEVIATRPKLLVDTRFGGTDGSKPMQLRAVDLDTKKGYLLARFWLSSAYQLPAGDWYLFGHIIDGSGNILIGNQILLTRFNPPSPQQQLRVYKLMFPSGRPSGAKAFAFGIYRPGDPPVFLDADQGQRDWGSHRVIVPLPPE
jgi:hypothetical protein